MIYLPFAWQLDRPGQWHGVDGGSPTGNPAFPARPDFGCFLFPFCFPLTLSFFYLIKRFFFKSRKTDSSNAD
jgi:hypothetical protein